MKRYINLYKNLLMLSLTVCISYTIQAEEQSTQETLEEVFRGITNKDLTTLNNNLKTYCAQLTKKTICHIVGDDSTNTLTSISDTIDEISVLITSLEENLSTLITSSIKNLTITTQLGLVNANAAKPALTTTLIITNSDIDVTTYNTHIATALIVVATAVNIPSKTNTIAAQAALAVAMADFSTIITSHSNSLAIMSLYSITEINDALAQLNAQLRYLYILQNS